MDDNTTTVGTTGTITVEFRNTAKQLADPTATSIRVLKPDGTYATITGLTRLSTGVYQGVNLYDQPDRWWFTGVGTGAIAVTSMDVSVFVHSTKTVGP